MRALSLTQPWATLVALGAKRVETRSWSTEYRGPLAIHAAAGFPRDARVLCWTDPFYTCLKKAGFEANLKPEKVLPLGALVAVCDLIDCVKIGDFRSAMAFLKHVGSPDLAVQDMSFGDYSEGRFMWFLSNARALPAPVPARGALGLWEIGQALERLVTP